MLSQKAADAKSRGNHELAYEIMADTLKMQELAVKFGASLDLDDAINGELKDG